MVGEVARGLSHFGGAFSEVPFRTTFYLFSDPFIVLQRSFYLFDR